MPFHKCDPPIYRLLLIRQVGTKFIVAEDLSAIEAPVFVMLKYYPWPDQRYVAELVAGVDSIAVQHETAKRAAMRAFNEMKRRKELWYDPERPKLADKVGSRRRRFPRGESTAV